MLEEVLPDADYRLQMRFQKRDVRDFFKPRPSSDEVLRERTRWLQSAPDTHSALHPEGQALLEETLALAIALHTIPSSLTLSFLDLHDPLARCRQLGRGWEPDFLLIRPDREGVFRLRGGCVCFPSHWSLEDKMGRTLAEIHAPVPTLNTQLGRQMDGFLAGIKPGISWERVNWGLSRSAERNQHPSRGLPRLDATVTPGEVWLRIEEQSLVGLPETGGVLFGIRIVTHPLTALLEDGDAALRLRKALASMSEPVAVYKGLADARRRLIELLEGGA